MPLTMVNTGQTVGIQKINGCGSVRQHLTDLGFVVGDEVTIVSNNGGNLIVQVKGARVALDMKMANRIMAA